MSSQPINIVSVERVGKHLLRLTFDDGKVQEVDFRPFLENSRHPAIRAYLDEGLFDGYRLEYGELVWGDYDLCFPIMDLYLNRLDKHTNLEAAA